VWGFGDTQSADEYAEKYAKDPNKAYYTYGNDCADYVSQLLHEAAIPMLATYEHVPLDWWTKEPVDFVQEGQLVAYPGDHTNSWTLARSLYEE
jgi:hypothetical protein